MTSKGTGTPDHSGERIIGVLFDLGGTLIESPTLATCVRTLEDLGCVVDSDQFVHAYRESVEVHDSLERTGPDLDAFWLEVLSKVLGQNVALRVVKDFISRYETTRPRASLFSDVRRCLTSLRDQRRVLGVVSNSRSEGHVRNLLKEAGIESAFRAVVSSGSEGVSKPDPEIFKRAVERIGARERLCAYVGDLQNTDARAAIRAGLHGVWLNRAGAGFSKDPPEITSLLELPRWVENLERRLS